MAKYDELPVFKATYDLLLRIYMVSQHWSRDIRYTLGEELKKEVIEILQLIYQANASKKKGFIGADNDFMSTIARRQGYLDGLRVLNIPPREDDQTFAGRDYSFASGVEAARRLLARPERPTALFCISGVLRSEEHTSELQSQR